MLSTDSGSLTPTVARDRHVGMRWLVSPTHDWRKPAPDAFHWVVWLPTPDGEGTWRVSGFTSSRWSAHADVLDVCVKGWQTPDGWLTARKN